ncbi:hypothetical protein MRB53_009568 [Persea americana]|uniref:Uncharacterized protein n=1 Tax=Persea americana TaxID=3435 RepID=A0ACC2LQK2_PERAE|nr:hypothetical protein MRB53_009568 [Persea americana]
MSSPMVTPVLTYVDPPSSKELTPACTSHVEDVLPTTSALPLSSSTLRRRYSTSTPRHDGPPKSTQHVTNPSKQVILNDQPTLVPRPIQVDTRPATTSSLTKPQRPHTMWTHSMDGMYKPKNPKTLIVTRYPLPKALQAVLGLAEPTCYTQALKSREWRAAMAIGFYALQR